MRTLLTLIFLLCSYLPSQTYQVTELYQPTPCPSSNFGQPMIFWNLPIQQNGMGTVRWGRVPPGEILSFMVIGFGPPPPYVMLDPLLAPNCWVTARTDTALIVDGTVPGLDYYGASDIKWEFPLAGLIPGMEATCQIFSVDLNANQLGWITSPGAHVVIL